MQDELPDYYEFTKLPLALDTIEVWHERSYCRKIHMDTHCSTYLYSYLAQPTSTNPAAAAAVTTPLTVWEPC